MKLNAELLIFNYDLGVNLQTGNVSLYSNACQTGNVSLYRPYSNSCHFQLGCGNFHYYETNIVGCNLQTGNRHRVLSFKVIQ